MRIRAYHISMFLCLTALLPLRLTAATLRELPDSCSLINYCGAAWSSLLDTPMGPCNRSVDWNGRTVSLFYTFAAPPEYYQTLTGIDSAAVRASLQAGLAAIGADWVHVTSVSGKKELCTVNVSLDDNPWCRPRRIGFGEQGRNKIGIWGVLQGGKPASVRLLPAADTVSIFPHQGVRLRISNVPQGGSLRLSPSNNMLLPLDTAPAGDDNFIDCTMSLGNSTYSFSDPAVRPFTVAFPDIFNLELIMDGETLLDPAGRVAEVPVSGYYDYSTFLQGAPAAFQDMDQVISLFSPLEEYCNTGLNPDWPQGYQLSYRFDEGTVFLQITCPEQMTGERITLKPGLRTRSAQVTFYHEEPVFHAWLDAPAPVADLDTRGGFASLTVRGYELTRGDNLSYRTFSSESQARGFFSPLLKKCSLGIAAGWNPDYLPGIQFLPDSNFVLLSVHGPANTGISLRYQDTGTQNLSGQPVRFRQDTIPAPPVSPDSLNWTGRMTYDGAGHEARSVTYYDGLGYPDQIISVGGAADGLRDRVQPVTFDEHDRQARTWLPLPASGNGLPQAQVLSAQEQYYTTLYPNQMTPARAFSETVFEAGPEGRPLREHLPGAAYADTAHALRYAYTASAQGDVLRMDVDGNGALRVYGYHMDKAFRCTRVQSPDSSIVLVYTDMSGAKVLERQLLTEGVFADTYYVYDRLGRLAYVITPEGCKDLTVPFTAGSGSPFVQNYCYRYAYDARGRVVSRHAPGGATRTFQYDNADRLIHAWDGAPENGGLYYEYDVFGRVLSEKLDTLATGAPTGFKTMRTCFYDAYPQEMDTRLSFRPEDEFTHPHGVSMLDMQVTGLLTCEEIAVVGASGFLRRAYYYDYEGNLLQQADLYPDGGLLRTSSSYGIRGELVRQRFRFMPPSGTGELVYDQMMQYDLQGRLLSEDLSMNGSAVSRTQYAYDDLGQVTGKTVSGGKPAAALAESFSYTLQGWQSGHTALDANGNALFTSNLWYESPSDTTGIPNYSGFISQQDDCQGSTASLTTRALYEYDRAGHLAETHIGTVSGPTGARSYAETGYRFDRNGNMTSLVRSQGSGPADTLSFSYSGNRLSAQNGTSGFAYNHAGNQTCDPTAGLTLHWNHLGQPDSVCTTGGAPLAAYAYLADGTRLEGKNCATGTTLFYRGPFVFKSNVFFNFAFESAAAPGGRIRQKAIVVDIVPLFPLTPVGDAASPQGGGSFNPGATLQISYFLDRHVTDHLGNVRVIVDGQGGQILERKDYLPLGLTATDRTYPNLSDNRYRFSGKEEQAALGVPYTDFGARMYNPVTGRWLSPDPLAEDHYSVSPYAFCAGNPVNFVDPDGKRTFVRKREDGTYEIIGGELNDDLGIYLDGIVSKETIIGFTETVTAFYNSDTGKWATTQIIDPKDYSGSSFLQKILFTPPDLFVYMWLARTNGPYDFKAHLGSENIYQGMFLKMQDGYPVYTSARDIGNIAAGYMAGINNIPYSLARTAFDAYQSYQETMRNKTKEYLYFVTGFLQKSIPVPKPRYEPEGPSTQNAQYYGWRLGYKINR